MTTTTKTNVEHKKWSWSKFNLAAAPYVFASPFFISFAIFGLLPIVFSFMLAFGQWDSASSITSFKWVGLSNFQFIFTEPEFFKSIYNTFWIAIVSGLPQHFVAIPLAYVLHTQVKRLKHFYTAAFLVPYITSTVAISLVITVLFSERSGAINQFLLYLNQFPLFDWLIPDKTGENYIKWLYEKEYTKPLVCLLVFWRYFGYNMILYMAGLQTISSDVYEAAEVDGASKWQQFWYISLPLLKPMAYFAVTGTIIGNLNLFDEVFILYAGPPAGGEDNSAQTIGLYLYRNAFVLNDTGAGAATAWVLFLIILAITLLNNLIFGKAARAEA